MFALRGGDRTYVLLLVIGILEFTLEIMPFYSPCCIELHLRIFNTY